ncbi:diguanylate cyclase|uniref:diguanylate cyclase domain-containing protein n=1 Tax=Noviherbaspirillum sp. L7-7A TaxID=2850560 RepID=UPI001C2C99AB|nr:diguanylate cyclase [Noviherbaspirillum sp. L7-7A]MBV0878250.1 diguanylate cyclase [Noviherbaspirillum sp. L7-7A]
MSNHCTLLYAESDALRARDVQRRLEPCGIDAILVSSDMAGITALSQHRIDMLVANFRLASGSGLDILRSARKSRPDLPVLLLVEPADIAQAAPALRQENLDYLVKDSEELYIDQLPRLARRLVPVFAAENETNSRTIDAALEKERSLMLAIANSQESGLAVFDPQYRLRLCNARFSSLLGLPESLTGSGNALVEILHYRAARGDFGDAAFAEVVEQQMRRLTSEPAFCFEQENSAGTACEIRGNRLDDGSLMLKVTELGSAARLEQHNWRNANFDSLTGLPGRALFVELLKHQVQRGSRCGYNGAALLLLDLDGFRQLNQAYGNRHCDQLLAEVARRLMRAVRESDVVGRLNGDQFGILVVDVNTSENTEIVAGKLLAAIARPFRIDGMEIRITASIGICFHPAELHSATSLVDMVEEAVVKAKTAGKNRYMFA